MITSIDREPNVLDNHHIRRLIDQAQAHQMPLFPVQCWQDRNEEHTSQGDRRGLCYSTYIMINLRGLWKFSASLRVPEVQDLEIRGRNR